MKRIILRVDDICATTRPADLEMLYGLCWARGIPVCLSVIPQAAYRFGPTGPVPGTPTDIRDNPELVAFLHDKLRAGLVEIALHGWQHHHGEWAEGSADAIRSRLENGLSILCNMWPDASIRVVVPPHDYLSPTGYRVIRRRGLGICSTWAATHGGTRRAQWRGRFRRWRGLPFARAAFPRWPTDVTLLDFAGPESGDWPETERLLRLAARWGTPVVFVQHPWRLLDANGEPNARADRWWRWLDRIADQPDVHVERFSRGVMQYALSTEDRTPQFSVIVTTHNRPWLVVRCIESVLAQTFSADRYEIVVVDDGSRPRTARVLAPYRARGQIRYLWQPQQGWGAARVLGVLHSQGEIVAFLDDDCIAPPGWLARYAEAYAAHPDADGIGGGLRPGTRMNVAGRKQYAGHLAYFNRLNAPLDTQADRAGRAWFTFGGNRTFRRAAWLSAQPGQGAWYYDDTLIDLTLRKQGAIIYYEPEAWVTHHYVLSVPQRIQAACRYGRSEVHTPAVEARLPPEGGVWPYARNRRVSWLNRWRNLRADVATAAWWEIAWYAATQPSAWIARRIGRWTAQRGG